MNDVFLAHVVRMDGEKRESVLTFVHPVEAEANCLAGQAVDALADMTGFSFSYLVEPIPYVFSVFHGKLIEMAREIGQELRDAVECFGNEDPALAWSMADQRDAMRHGWQLTLYDGDGQILIEADDEPDPANPPLCRFHGQPNADERAEQHVRVCAEDAAEPYRSLCAKALRILAATIPPEVECSNCSWEGAAADMVAPTSAALLQPGAMPEGVCPKCGHACQLTIGED